MKPLAVVCLSVALPFVCAIEPLPLSPPALLPQPVQILQQNGQLVLTDKSPIPVMVIQKQPQLWTTSTGQVLMPLNLSIITGKEGGK